MSDALFAFERVCFQGHATAALLSDVTLSLRRGERIGILGENGSGKSTLLHIGAGLLPPASGRVLYAGRPCLSEKDFVPARKTLGYLLQHAEDQLFCPTLLEDLAFGPYNLGCSAAEAEEKARAMLEEVGLTHLAGRNGQRLSGGEQTLAALASILVMEPSFLFLDEPTNNLDEHARALVRELLRRHDLPALIVSHDRPFLRETCTSFRILEKGRLVEADL